ncbi:GNAT family N-acetyltransferase [Providencia rettgeri]
MHFIVVTPQDTQLIEQISRALHHEWRHLPPWENISAIRMRLIERCSHDNRQILSCYADKNGNLLATASTILHELTGVHQATWWLGEALTVPEARGHKMGSKLIEELYNYYHNLIGQSLYLYTPDMQQLYRRMGWKDVEERIVNHEQVTVMKR